MWQLTYKWARRTHPNKPTRWIVRRYFGAFNKSRRDRRVFGDRVSGAYLLKLAWTRIVRHQMVTGTASPDDPALTDYWNTRRRKGIRLPIDGTRLRLLHAQHGRCARCGQNSITLRERAPGAIDPTSVSSTHAATHGSPAHHQPAKGFLSRMHGNRARPVLRGPGAAMRPPTRQ